jgi:hypothetical protein
MFCKPDDVLDAEDGFSNKLKDNIRTLGLFDRQTRDLRLPAVSHRILIEYSG